VLRLDLYMIHMINAEDKKDKLPVIMDTMNAVRPS
jgi:hypothetical protein